MSDLTLHPAELTAMSVQQLAALPALQLADVDRHLDELLDWTKKTRAKLDAALDQRIGDAARASLRASGRDFGITHVDDGALRIKFDLPKKVTWDQAKLKAIAERIKASGEPIEHYLDVKLSVPESRYTNWPPTLRQQFADARTVEPGKPSFTLTAPAPAEGASA